MSEILQKDNQYVWHPFTHLKYSKNPINIVRTAGACYFDENGNKIIDAISSWWVNLHGHCNPYISEKVSEQLFINEHSIFSDFTHPKAALLAERLINKLPSSLSRIFYSDNGSTAVEVALKMSIQFWQNSNSPKSKFICFQNAYHGDTFGGMSVAERNVFNQAFTSFLFDVVHVPTPTNENIIQLKNQFTELIKTGKIAGFIYEPIVQGASGMLMYEPDLLNELLAICKNSNIITIADEVMTGFGRTGTWFASNQMENLPDIICLSKGLTGGYMPLGATACSEKIYNAFRQDDKTKTFFHGHSYTANPIACSAALASLDLMEKKETWEKIKWIEKMHIDFQTKIKEYSFNIIIRCKGTILAIELIGDEKRHYLNELSENVSSYFLEKGILLRPLGNVFYIIPPYCISTYELEYIYEIIFDFLEKFKH